MYPRFKSCTPPAAGCQRPGKWRGFTAIELMVVVAILAIIAAIALPNFNLTIEVMRTNSVRDNVQGAVLYARSEAVRTRRNVLMERRPLSDCRPGEGEDAQDWSCGWRIFVDTNNNRIQDDNEPTLRETGELTGVTLIHAGGTSATSVVFNNMGYSNSTPGRFTAYPRGNIDANRASVRTLCLNRTGRARPVNGDSC